MLVLPLNVLVVITSFATCPILENKACLEISNNGSTSWFSKCSALLSKLLGTFWKGKEKR